MLPFVMVLILFLVPSLINCQLVFPPSIKCIHPQPPPIIISYPDLFEIPRQFYQTLFGILRIINYPTQTAITGNGIRFFLHYSCGALPLLPVLHSVYEWMVETISRDFNWKEEAERGTQDEICRCDVDEIERLPMRKTIWGR